MNSKEAAVWLKQQLIKNGFPFGASELYLEPKKQGSVRVSSTIKSAFGVFHADLGVVLSSLVTKGRVGFIEFEVSFDAYLTREGFSELFLFEEEDLKRIDKLRQTAKASDAYLVKVKAAANAFIQTRSQLEKLGFEYN